MKYAWPIAAVLAARFFASALVFPPGDGDLFWQRWLGATILRTGHIPRALGPQAFAAPGAPWTPQEWLFSIAASLARSGLAWDVFAAALALAPIAALLLAAARAEKRGASPRAIAFGMTCAGIALLESFGVRAQVAAWPLLALFLLLLEWDGALAYAAIAVAALWSNVHASAMLAPVLAAIFAGGALLDDGGWSPRARRRALVALGSLAAICCNPFGWGLPLYAVSLFGSSITHYIEEWRPSTLGDPAFAFGVLPLALGAILAAPRDGRRGLCDSLVLAVFGYLALFEVRNVPIFALVAFPIVAERLTRSVPFFAGAPAAASSASGARPWRARFAGVAVTSFALAVTLGVGVRLAALAPPTSGANGAPAIAAIRRLPGTHRVFCANFAWCGALIGYRNLGVFIDGRADPYPPRVWREYVGVVRLAPGWEEVLRSQAVDTVVVSRGSALDQALRLGGGWQPMTTGNYRVWLRAPVRAALRGLQARDANHLIGRA